MVLGAWCVLAANPPAVMAGAVASGPASQAAQSVPTSAQLEEIQAVAQPQALVEMARRYVLFRQDAAARVCIEKACLADPSLLTDTKPMSPQSWRRFWCRHRAFLRARKLAPSDAAGRVQLAVWLNEAGERGEARRMLQAALEIDPNLEAARTLAKTWRLDSGGPFRFDLTFGLSHPLLFDSFSDEGEKIELRHGHSFMLLPFAYEPAEGPLRILKNSVQVKGEGSQRPRVLGIVLLTFDPSTKPALPLGPDPSTLKLDESQPLWERIQVERKEDGTLDLVASNLTRPPGKRAAMRKTSGERKTGGSTPMETDSHAGPQASGYAAFLIDVPTSMTKIEAVYEDDVEFQVETRLLDVLGRPLSNMSAKEQAQFVDVLAGKVLDPNPLIASAAVAKLGQIRQGLKPPGPDAGSALPTGETVDPLQARIDQTLWSALSHADVNVRRKAFEAMVMTDRPIGPTLLGIVRDPGQANLTLTLLDQVERALTSTPATGQPAVGASPTDGAARVTAAQLKITGLEASPAPANVFRVLAACVTSQRPEIVQRAVDIILADGSEQAVLILADLPADGRSLLAERLAKVNEPVLKAALVRVLLYRPDPAIVGKLLEACRDLKMAVAGPDDPILNAFRGRAPRDARLKLVSFLGHLDLSAIAGTSVIEDILAALATDAQRDPELQSALLELARSGFQESYQAPLESVRRNNPAENKPSCFTGLLARIAGAQNADPATARAAAAALLEAGRLKELQDKLKLMPSAADRARLIAGVGANTKLWAREALPMFLASCLGDSDSKCALAALTALGEIYKGTNASQRWRLNLAVKLGLDQQALMRCTQAPDEKLARLSVSLLRQLTQMSQAESDQLDSLTDAAARQQYLTDLEKKRTEKPAGKYACVVYVDLKPGNVPPAGGNSPGAARIEQPMSNVPLLSATVNVQLEGNKIAQILADDRYIGMPDDRGNLSPSPGQLIIDAAPLILDGLRWADEQKQAFAGKVDRLGLSERLRCELRHQRLGTWCGEVTINQKRAPDPGVPLQVTGGIVFLEPLGEPSPPPKAADVEEK